MDFTARSQDSASSGSFCSSVQEPAKLHNTHTPTGMAESGGDSRSVPADPIVRYRECRKNFAASSGGYVVDGCGEFIPSGQEHSYNCAACQCHRNFHRKEVAEEPVAVHSGKWRHSAGMSDVDMDMPAYGCEKHGKSEKQLPVRK